MLVKDPVCGMEIEAETAQSRQEHKGVTYYFCSQSCQQKFRSDPDKFIQHDREAR